MGILFYFVDFLNFVEIIKSCIRFSVKIAIPKIGITTLNEILFIYFLDRFQYNSLVFIKNHLCLLIYFILSIILVYEIFLNYLISFI